MAMNAALPMSGDDSKRPTYRSSSNSAISSTTGWAIAQWSRGEALADTLALIDGLLFRSGWVCVGVGVGSPLDWEVKLDIQTSLYFHDLPSIRQPSNNRRMSNSFKYVLSVLQVHCCLFFRPTVGKFKGLENRRPHVTDPVDTAG